MTKLSQKEYFKDEKLACKCGCGKNNFKKSTRKRLNRARDIAGVPFIVNSACRCAEHNRKVGSKPTSSHLVGVAMDIRAEDSVTRFAVLEGLMKAGFKRIGIHKDFIHADDDPTKPPRVAWMY